MSKPPYSLCLLPQAMRITYLSASEVGLVLNVEPEAGCPRCPMCSSRSERVHILYIRTTSDLPWHRNAVALNLRARKFFGDRPSCKRKISCARLEEIAARARKTGRLEVALLTIALGLGEEAGARLARQPERGMMRAGV